MSANFDNIILSYSLDELRQIFKENGFDSYRALQVYNGIYSNLYKSFNDYSNLPANLISYLKEKFIINPIKLSSMKKSKLGDTYKYIFKLYDNFEIESVAILESNRTTLCISSQVGCALKCSFCATGTMGMKRNLKTGEIIAQFLSVLSYHKNIDNIVFMGMGEPLLNYESVKKAIEILNSKYARNFGIRRITLSTAGIPNKIKCLADDNMQIRLAVSLHSPFQSYRVKLMPFSSKLSLEKLLDACKYYYDKTLKRITFEYVLLKNVNMGIENVKEIAKWRHRFRFNINLIPYNPVNDKFIKPSSKEVKKFASYFRVYNIEVVVRKLKGDDISAACGQLVRNGLIKNAG